MTGRGVRVSLCCVLAALVVGVGGFDVSGIPAVAIAEPETTRLAYPHPPPRDLLPPPAPIDAMLPDAGQRIEIVRTQERLTRLALARAASAAVRARPVELAVAPALEPGTRVEVTLSYYYCTPGPSGRRVGDGGGFCGKMRNGAVVHSGASACAASYLGQRFRVIGDPTERTYTCEDTGSAVHGLHRDVWFRTADAGRNWIHTVGQRAVIEILR